MTRRYTKRPLIERVLRRIELSEHGGCWLWSGARNSDDYGLINVAGKSTLVHRVVFGYYHGPIPPDRPQIDHLCRVPACCNPDHLEAVTNAENSARGNAASRSLVCPYGHWLIGGGSFREPRRGARCGFILRCRTCDNARQRRRYAARRAAATPPVP